MQSRFFSTPAAVPAPFISGGLTTSQALGFTRFKGPLLPFFVYSPKQSAFSSKIAAVYTRQSEML